MTVRNLLLFAGNLPRSERLRWREFRFGLPTSPNTPGGHG